MAKPKVTVPTFLSMGELAEHMSVTERTIRREIAAGNLRAHRFGRLVRIAHEDAAAYLAARRH